MAKSKFLLALLATICAAPLLAGDLGPLPNWSTAASAPDRVAQPTNILRLDGELLLWNGQNASETDIRKYLVIITNQMNPQPQTILTYSAQTPSERIQRARLLVEEIVQCKPAECLEVTSSQT